MTAKAKLAESNFASLADMMSAYAEEAVRVAWDDHRRRLDLSESSVDTCWSRSWTASRPKIWNSRPASGAATLARSSAAALHGEWELGPHPSGGVAAVPTVVIRGGRLYPLMKVYRRLTLGEAESLPAFYKMVSTRLEEPSK